MHRVLDRNRAIDQRRELNARRDLRLHSRDEVLHRRRNLDGVRPRLPLDREHDRARAVEPARYLVVLHVIEHVPDVPEPDRRTVPVRHDHSRERCRVLELAVRLNRVRLVRPPQNARRQIDVLIADGARDLVDTNLAIRQRRRIELHTHRVLLRAVDDDLRDTSYHRDALGQHGLAVLVELGQWKELRCERKEKNRLVCGIDLLIRRRDDPGR